MIKVLIGFVICCVILMIIFITNYILNNEKKIYISNELEIICSSAIGDFMPPGDGYYIFTFNIKNISKEEFDDKYELKKAEINGKVVNKKDIDDLSSKENGYKTEYKTFSIHSEKGELGKNTIKLIFKDKKENRTFYEEIEAYAEFVC